MKFEVPINVDIDDVTKLIHDLQCLQTYKLGVNDTMVLVSLDDVADVFADHIKAKRLDKDTNVPTKWIPVSEKLPEEHDTMFAKYWGTDRWNKYMFRKRSDKVEVTVELDDGTRVTDASHTRDGKWDIEEKHGFVHKKVVAWHHMSEPWKGEENE